MLGALPDAAPAPPRPYTAELFDLDLELDLESTLQALMLIEAAQRSWPGLDPLTGFAYRLQAPAWGAGPLTAYVSGPGEFTLRDAAGRVTASATATW